MLQFGMLFLPFFGYYAALFICKKGKDTAFYPAIIVSGIVVAGFFAGLINQMKLIYMLIFWMGLLLLVGLILAIALRRCSLPRLSLAAACPFFCFFLGSLILFLVFQGRFLYSYDDFSHWGKVAQVISVNQRLPLAEDGLSFTSYPVGSSLFIAYCANILGASADTYLFSQALMVFAFYMPLMAASDKLWIQLCVMAAIVLFIQYNISLEMLSVDNLLSAVAVAGIMMCLDIKKDKRNQLPELALVLATLTLIKNSGVFLAVIILGYAVFLCIKAQNAKWRLLYFLLPAFVFILWHVYTNHTFAHASKHALSVTYYQTVLSGKQEDGIKTTLKIILPLLLKPSANHALYLIPGYCLSLFLLWRSKQLVQYKSVFWFAAILLVVYEIGILLMYVLSMPTSEVIYQNGQDYYRYNGTVVAILAAVLTALLCISAPECFPVKWTKKAIYSFVCCLMICVNVVFTLYLGTVRIQSLEARREAEPTAAKLVKISGENSFPPDASFVILYDMPDTVSYHFYLSSYYLNTKNLVRCYDQDTWINECAQNPQSYCIDLNTCTVSTPRQ